MTKITVSIYIPDSWDYRDGGSQGTVESWACEHCKSYICREFIDMSDLDSWSGEYDAWFDYTFGNEEDAMMFKLKWG